jgi:hypothetical protein
MCIWRDASLPFKIIEMEILYQPYISANFIHESKKTIPRQFLDWCKGQERNRLLWLSLIVAGHGCIITPITLLILVFTGNSMFLWAFAIAAMTMSLVTNLAALPTKITIPVFFLSLVMDLIVVSCSLAYLTAGV